MDKPLLECLRCGFIASEYEFDPDPNGDFLCPECGATGEHISDLNGDNDHTTNYKREHEFGADPCCESLVIDIPPAKV